MGVKVFPSPLFAKYTDEQIEALRMDASTHTLQTITYEHHEVHGGSMFEVITYVDLPINNVWDVQITTAASDKWCHFLGAFNTENETNWWFYEGVTINVAGTALASYNSNRNSTNTASMTLASITNADIADANADTAVASATTLFSGISGSGRSGGQASRQEELILRANTDYSLRFEAAVAGYVNISLYWYEHTDKD